MPALRIVIIETQGRLEPLTRAACRKRPAHVMNANDTDTLTKSCANTPPGIVLIEHHSNVPDTVALVERTVELGFRAIVFLAEATSPEARMVLRTAGAVQLIDQLPPFTQWQAWVDRWMDDWSIPTGQE